MLKNDGNGIYELTLTTELHLAKRTKKLEDVNRRKIKISTISGTFSERTIKNFNEKRRSSSFIK